MKRVNKNKSSLFRIAPLVFLLLFLASCSDKKSVRVESHEHGGVVTIDGAYTPYQRALYEIDYKGHTYVACEVRDGLALTHAGHCWCNEKPGSLK